MRRATHALPQPQSAEDHQPRQIAPPTHLIGQEESGETEREEHEGGAHEQQQALEHVDLPHKPPRRAEVKASMPTEVIAKMKNPVQNESMPIIRRSLLKRNITGSRAVRIS